MGSMPINKKGKRRRWCGGSDVDNNDGHYSRNRTDSFCNDVILGMRAHLKNPTSQIYCWKFFVV